MIILLDTSVWVELLDRKPGRAVSDEVLLNLATCGPVVQEVLRGLRDHPASDAFGQSLLALPIFSDLLPSATFVSAGEIYRLGRAKGYTIRSSTDCLIAAIAIESRVPVGRQDRDFGAIARYTALRAHQVK